MVALMRGLVRRGSARLACARPAVVGRSLRHAPCTHGLLLASRRDRSATEDGGRSLPCRSASTAPHAHIVDANARRSHAPTKCADLSHRQGIAPSLLGLLAALASNPLGCLKASGGRRNARTGPPRSFLPIAALHVPRRAGAETPADPSRTNALTGRSRCVDPHVSASSEVERAKARRTQPTHATTRHHTKSLRALRGSATPAAPGPTRPKKISYTSPRECKPSHGPRLVPLFFFGRVVLQCAPLRTLVRAVRVDRIAGGPRKGSALRSTQVQGASAALRTTLTTLRGDAPNEVGATLTSQHPRDPLIGKRTT